MNTLFKSVIWGGVIVTGVGLLFKAFNDMKKNVTDDVNRFKPEPLKEEHQTEAQSESSTEVVNQKPKEQGVVDTIVEIQAIKVVYCSVAKPVIRSIIKSLMFNQTYRFGAIADDGRHTGHGYVFESIILNSLINAHKPIKQPDSKNGKDFIIGNKSYQAKCCCSGCYEQNLFNEKGQYKYGEQHIIVPKGHGVKVQRLLAKHGVKREIIEMNVSYAQCRNIARMGSLSGVAFDIQCGFNSLFKNLALIGGKILAYEFMVTEMEYQYKKEANAGKQDIKRKYKFKRWLSPGLCLVTGCFATYVGASQLCRYPHAV